MKEGEGKGVQGVGSMRVWRDVFRKYRRIVERRKRVLGEMDDKNKEEGRNLTSVKHSTHALNALNGQTD